MKNILFKRAVTTVLLLTASIFLGRAYGYNISAQTNPPSFPACTDKIFTQSGDWASYDSGTHGIPGVGNFEGSDDVYSLTNGNFLQCFCPSQGDQGIQTNWWNVERAGLTSDQLASFISQGWISENGSGWNLFNEAYLAKNSNFNCTQITPTVTPIPTSPPSGGGGGGPVGAPICNAPAVSKAPLYSRANLSRIDSDSIKISWIVTDEHAKRYGIFYGTSSDNLSWYTEVQGHDTKETVINLVPAGNIFFKICSIGECGDKECGSDIPTVLGAAKGLPAAGTAALTLLGFAPIGYYLIKRFKII